MRAASLVMVSLMFVGPPGRPASPGRQPQDDQKLASILESISKTAPEGLLIIEKVKRLKPRVNAMRAARRLGEIIEDFSTNKGQYNITPIGWEAAQKKSGRWKVVFYYQDYRKEYQAAEWEYNPETNRLYPFELNNAPQFWTSEYVSDRPLNSGGRR